VTSILSLPRHILVAARDRWDAHTHPSRRAAAQARLRDRPPTSIVFVCLGNVCRSPYAARVAEKVAGDRLAFDSAGFIGPGRQPPDAALRVALERGTDHADHRSKLLTPELADEAGVLIVFDRYNIARMRSAFPHQMDRVFWLGDFDPVWAGKRAIIDPWGKEDTDFHVTFERIERCVAEMIATLDGAGRTA
jgi:protein-tyrosine-phosphatase